jgi:hypothetical protein
MLARFFRFYKQHTTGANCLLKSDLFFLSTPNRTG